MPFLPDRDTRDYTENAETVEGAVFVWDGSGRRVDFGTGFQWLVNPWLPHVGTVQSWADSSSGYGQWVEAGRLRLDLEWHTVTMTVDYPRRRTRLLIDGNEFRSAFTETRRDGWGPDTLLA